MAKNKKQSAKKNSKRSVKPAPKKGSVSTGVVKKAVKKSKKKPPGKKKGLTARQKRFIEEYCVTYNATRSAITAGYSEKTARSIGQENLTKPDIKEAISKRMSGLSMSAEEAIKRLGDMGRGSFEHFMVFDEKTWTLRIDLSKPGAKEKLHLIRKIKQNDTILKDRNNKDQEVIDRTFEIELHDAKDAVDKILKVHGRYIDNLNLSVTAEKWDPEKGDPKEYIRQQLSKGDK